MKTLRNIAAALITVFFLYGCDQNATQQSADTPPTAEEANITSKSFGDYELHFNAISTDQLQPEIARAYNIARSKNRAMLNVSILKSNGSLTGSPISGEVNITVTNLTGQSKDLTVKQIRDGEAIYYVGDVAIANAETLVFDIKALPEGESKELTVRFVRQFYSN